MGAVRPFFWLSEILFILHSPVNQLLYLYILFFYLFRNCFPPFFRCSLSPSVSIIPENMRSSGKIQLYLTTTTVHGRACAGICGRPQARGRVRGQSSRETQRTLFPTALRSRVGSVNRSPAQKSVSPLDAAPLCNHQSSYHRRISRHSPVIGPKQNWRNVCQVHVRSILMASV